MNRGARLRRADALLLAAALALFALCLALNVREQMRGGFVWLPLHVSAPPPGGHPRVRSFWADRIARESGIAVGDELLALDGESLAGAGPFRFATRLLGLAGERRALPVSVRSAGEARDAALPLPPVPFAWRTTLFALAFVGLGALAFWRTRGFPPARCLFLFAFGYALHWTYFWGGSPAQSAAAIAAFALGPMLAAPFALRAVLSFPLETASESRGARLWPFAFAVLGLGSVSWAFGVPLPPSWGLRVTVAGSALWAAALLVLLTRNYRRAGPTGRRQIKWVLVGLYLASAPPALAAAATLAEPRLAWLYEASLLSVICLPIALFVALGRDHLYDVDRLISASATYTILCVLATAGLGVVVPRVTRLLAGGESGVVQAGLSLVVAAGVVAARRWVGPRVQRAIFRERVALERGALALRGALAASEKPSDLIDALGTQLDGLLAPTCTAIYAVTGEEMVPVFVRGPAAAPGFGIEKGLAQQLAGERGVLVVPARRRHPFWQGLGPDEASALDAMGAALLVPLRVRGVCAGFVCLGDKRSGDVYTEQDRALLASIAEKASDELVRFHELELRQAEREMNARLRRYVPGAIAEQLERGDALAPGEREVTVLFVDVRGYSSFAEPRSPAQIFEAVSAYTRAVSELVREWHGTVVEFNGDGMMAVFGAPEALPDRERAAVSAALAIRRRVRALRFGEDGAGLDVGIGIASGPAYVGSIQAVDRAIWSALGNTTNLAARLQSMTRDHDASIALDEATWRGAGEAARSFRSLGVLPIRGRRPLEVFTLPLSDPA